MGLFYTGKGDKGTSFICNKKIDKTCCEMESLGHLDELNSLIGLVRSQNISWHTPRLPELLKDVQENLFTIQANIAILLFGKKFKAPIFPEQKIKDLEIIIDRLEKKINPEKGFVIPGETMTSGWLDFVRAVCRRAERETIRLSKKKKIAPTLIPYLNRLSGFFFACARYEAKYTNIKESHPRYT